MANQGLVEINRHMGCEEMSYNFIECNREQPYLLPPSLKEWLPEGHLAWFVLDATAAMDLGQFYAKYRMDAWGGCAYDPSMMVSLLLYAYCIGERSSRKIERLCEVDVAFRVIAANKMPDHCTIARFRKEHREALHGLFVGVLRLCAEAGLIKMGVVSIDGTKIKGNASLAANRRLDSIKREVERMLEEADAKDQEEDDLFGPNHRGDELPKGLRKREGRLARLKECKERLEKQEEEARAKQQEKIDQREIEEKKTGKKKRGRKPKKPEEVVNKEAKANVTDPESRIMKTRTGFVQGYNAQAVVTEDQIIIAAEVVQEENDVHQLQPMLAQVLGNLQAIDLEAKIGTVLADAGYWSEANAGLETGTELLIATTKDHKQRKSMEEGPGPRGRIPKALSPRDRMARRLLTKRGRALYKQRSVTVEPVFGQIKGPQRFGQFSQRGKCACNSEWNFTCAAHNLLKLWRRLKEGAIKHWRLKMPTVGAAVGA